MNDDDELDDFELEVLPPVYRTRAGRLGACLLVAVLLAVQGVRVLLRR